MARQQRLQGLIVGSRKQQVDMVRAIESTGVEPVIDKVFAFTDLAGAFEFQQSAEHFGKIVVEW